MAYYLIRRAALELLCNVRRVRREISRGRGFDAPKLQDCATGTRYPARYPLTRCCIGIASLFMRRYTGTGRGAWLFLRRRYRTISSPEFELVLRGTTGRHRDSERLLRSG